VSSHLNVFDGRLSLICEDFYDDFAKGCHNLLQDTGVMSKLKMLEGYFTTGLFSMGQGQLQMSSTGALPPTNR